MSILSRLQPFYHPSLDRFILDIPPGLTLMSSNCSSPISDTPSFAVKVPCASSRSIYTLFASFRQTRGSTGIPFNSPRPSWNTRSCGHSRPPASNDEVRLVCSFLSPSHRWFQVDPFGEWLGSLPRTNATIPPINPPKTRPPVRPVREFLCCARDLAGPSGALDSAPGLPMAPYGSLWLPGDGTPEGCW